MAGDTAQLSREVTSDMQCLQTLRVCPGAGQASRGDAVPRSRTSAKSLSCCREGAAWPRPPRR